MDFDNDQTLEDIMYSENQAREMNTSLYDTETLPKKSQKLKNSIKFNKEPEMVHFCNYCNASFKDILGLKAHIPRCGTIGYGKISVGTHNGIDLPKYAPK